MTDESNTEATLDEILDRFYANYEDAAHSVFYDGREGGYQFLPGAGPCDPWDVLQGEFPDASAGVRTEATNNLRSSGGIWVKKGTY